MKKSKSSKRAADAFESKSAYAYVATASPQKGGRPKSTFGDTGTRRRIVHRELVASVNGSVTFVAVQYSLNPGIAKTFPWLSTQAVGWEQYCFHKLAFDYVTRTATSTTGSVILSPEYDPSDGAPASEGAASNAMDAIEDACWKTIHCELTPTAMFPLGPRKYVRTMNQAGDVRTFDAGSMFVCTNEEPNTNGIGKLWVSYDVELFVPQTAPSTFGATQTTYLQGTAAAQVLNTTVEKKVAWDVTIDALSINPTGAATFTPPAGAYNWDLAVQVTDSVAETAQIYLIMYRDGAVDHASESHTPAGTMHQADLHGYSSFNGSEVVSFAVTVTAAAGALTLQQAGTSLRFTPA